MDTFTILDYEANGRLDKYLVKHYPSYSRSQIQKWIKEGNVKINDMQVKTNYKIQANDEVIVFVPEEVQIEIIPEDIDLEIVYEDEALLVVNKPSGMTVHPSQANESGTLVHALKYHIKQLSTYAGEERPGIVHRIDKDTSGLLVIAKNNDVHEALAKQFQNREVTRIYEAIVEGELEHEQGLIDAPIGRDPNRRTSMTVLDSGKAAKTKFKVLKHLLGATYVQCELITGRTHQIRVHMSYINHPLIGDEKYGAKAIKESTGQALFARHLAFTHPVTKQHLSFTTKPPKSFENILNKYEANA